MSTTLITTLNFNIPPDVANQGVSLGLYSNTSNLYLNSSYQFASIPSSGSLPLITLTTANSSNTEPVSCLLSIPAGQSVESGELFIFVDTVNTGLPINSGQVSAPSAAPSPATPSQPDNFAQFEFNYDGTGLDIDISAVDSVGFPFTLVYPSCANVPFPLNPLGITLDQTDIHQNFLTTVGTTSEFAQCATFAQQQDPQSLRVVAPQDILATETAVPTLNSATPTADSSSQLVAGANYYYLVTAFSNNVIANSKGIVGETLPSAMQAVTKLASGNSVQLSWNAYLDPNTAGYNVYRYSAADGGTPPNNDSLYNLIGSVKGVKTATFTDTGCPPKAQQISIASASNYGFNALSEYYTEEILEFFKLYTAPNSFALHRNGCLWVGNTVTYTPQADWNVSGDTYTVLQLTAQNSVAGITQGNTVNIYQPIFSSNTRFVIPNAPLMPSWMTNRHESPSQMVFGCDGVFASNTIDPDVASNGVLATALAAIENAIVSAFNRGIASNAAIQPDNWASFPQMASFPAVASDTKSQVTATATYYYQVTAVNVYGETTPSLEVSATLNSGQSATLNWSNCTNAAPATAFNIYRGTTPGNLNLLFTTAGGQQTSYTDEGASAASGSAPPNQYFAAGSTSNWYAAYVQTNSLLNPAAGVSINGLSYGFPYSDQGGVSTNLSFPPGSIPSNITVNLGELNAPGFVTQYLPDAVVNTAYSQTIVASGSGTDARFTVSSGALPSWLTLDDNTGVLSGTAPSAVSGPYTFTIKIAASNSGTAYMPFSIGVIDVPAQTLTIAGLSAGVLTLPAADIGVPYSAEIFASGGTGPYTLSLASGVQLPSGLAFGSFPITSTSAGQFTLSGTQTAEYNQPDTGFGVVVQDSAGNQSQFTVNIVVNPALAINTATLPDPAIDMPYTQAIITNNIGGSVSFTVTGGALPGGLALSAWGILSGTPASAGSFTFIITATDSAGGTASQPYTVSVLSSREPLAITTTALPPALPNAAYNQTVGTSGGSAPVTFAIVNGLLPNGLSLDSSSGVITGTPNAGGMASFTVRAVDPLGDAAYQGYEFRVLTITESTNNLPANAATLLIGGTGFDPKPANNQITLSSGSATVSAASATQLDISIAGLLNEGSLTATVTADGVTSASAQVATVIAGSTPTVTLNTRNLAANATTLVINGTGFDPDPAHNQITLSSGSATVSAASATQLDISIAGPLGVGALTATVTTNNVPSTPTQVPTSWRPRRPRSTPTRTSCLPMSQR